MRLNVLVLLLLIMLPCIGFSQKQIGLNTSDWNPSQSLFLNPAMAANKDLKFVIDLAGLNFGVDNDNAKLNTGKIVSNYFSKDNALLENMYRFSSNKPNINMTAPYAEVHGPGVLFTINGKQSIGINTRLRAMNQLNNFNVELYRSIANQSFTDGTQDYEIKSRNASWSANIWSDIGLTYAATIIDNGTHRLKGGINLHFLRGIGYVNAKVSNLDAHYYSKIDSLRITNSDLSFSSNILKTGSDLSSGIAGGDLMNRIFSGGAGSGFGTDLGLIYEYNPGTFGQNSYLIKTSVSITDIGSVTYQNGNRIVKASGDGYMYGRDLDAKLKNYSELQKYAQQHGINVDTSVGKTKMTLPTTMIIGTDLHYSEHGFVNITYVGNMRGVNKQGNSYSNQLTITPRFDSEVMSLGMPITMSSLSSKLKMGMFFRVSGFFIGSDDILGTIGSNQYGVNMYCGANIPLYKHYRIRRF